MFKWPEFYYKYHGQIMVKVAWLICGYHDLTVLTMYCFAFICIKTMVNGSLSIAQ